MAVLEIHNLNHAADQFMEIGFSDTGWNDALEALNTAVGGFGIAALPIFDRTPGPMPMTASLNDLFDIYVGQGWIHDDYRMGGLPMLLKKGVTVDQDFVNPESMDQIAYYQDFLAPFNLRWFGALRIQIGSETTALTMQRTPEQGPFLAHELDGLLSVSHRIANGIAQASRMADSIASGITDFYSASPIPIVSLDRTGSIIQFNQAAELLLGNGVYIRQKHLEVDKLDADRLKTFISALVASDKPEPADAGRGLIIRRQTGQPLVVYGQRIQIGRAWEYFSRPRAIVKIIDPETKPKSDTDLVARYLQISASEAKAAMAIFQANGSIVDGAELLGISHNTIRGYLKSLYQRTGINSVTKLNQLIDRILLQK